MVGGGLEPEEAGGAQSPAPPPFNPAGFIGSWLSGCGWVSRLPLKHCTHSPASVRPFMGATRCC